MIIASTPGHPAATVATLASLQLQHRLHSTCPRQKLDPLRSTVLPCQTAVEGPGYTRLLLPHVLQMPTVSARSV